MIAASNGRSRRARRIGTALTLLVGAAIGTAALTPATAQQFRTLGTIVSNTLTACSSPATCIGGKNTSTGPGVSGSSAKGNGVDSGTKNPSATTKVGRSGVYGHDDTMDKGTFNAGVAGFSTYGYGMQATSNLGIGLQANSSNGTALEALAAYGNGILAKSVTAHGVQASSDNSDAVVATTLNPSKTAGIGRSGVYGYDGSTDGGSLNVGVAGISPNGYGVFAQSTSGVGISASTTNGLVAVEALGNGVTAPCCVPLGTAVYAEANNNSVPPLYVVQDDRDGDLIDAYNFKQPVASAMRLDANANLYIQGASPNGGNIRISGLLFSSGSCSSGCSRVDSYGAQTSEPTLEDNGIAHLRNGSAYVALDPTFARAIDLKRPYMVTLTPEGDTRGLFATQKSARGFVVRENQSGRSSVLFDYRIVARPFGKTEPRLPMNVDHNPRIGRHPSPRRHPASLRAPEVAQPIPKPVFGVPHQ